MKSTIRFGAFIIAAGVSLPLLLSLYKNSFNNRKDLNTCMDVQAIVNEEPMSEATASETIDTMTKELASKEKESEEEDEQKRKQVVQLVEEAISFVNNNSFD